MDATLTPRYMSERGVLGGGELAIARGRPETSWGSLYARKTTNTTVSCPSMSLRSGSLPPRRVQVFSNYGSLADPGQARGRVASGLKHGGGFLLPLAIGTTFDLGTDLGVTSKVQLDRMAEIKPQAGGTRMRLWAEDIQLLEEGLPKPTAAFPQLDAAFRSRVLKTPLIFGYDLQYAAFDRSDAQAAETITGTRTHIAPRLVRSSSGAGAFCAAKWPTS